MEEKARIEPIGKLHDIEADGYVVNSAKYPPIQKEYQLPIQEIINFLIDINGKNIDSIYLRGSVAKGIAVHNISDVDFLIVSNKKIENEELSNMYSIVNKILTDKYPFIDGVELFFITKEVVLTNINRQFLLKTQCVCIFGTDIIDNLPKFKIDCNAISHAFTLERDANDAISDKHSCQWIMKRIVRVGFEICMIRAQKFTRDLYPNYMLFSEYYPEMREKMLNALTLAISPTSDIIEIKKVIDDIVPFLMEQVNVHLGHCRCNSR